MTNDKRKYKVVDWYEGHLHLGYAHTMTEVRAIARKFYKETDGECDIWYYPLDKQSNMYLKHKGKIATF